jgi:hypothetical protein
MWSVVVDESPQHLGVTLRATAWAKALAWFVLTALGIWAVLVTWFVGAALARGSGSALGIAWAFAYVLASWLPVAAGLAFALRLGVREVLRVDDAGLSRERWVWSRPRAAKNWPLGRDSAFSVGFWPGFFSSPRSRTTPLVLDDGIEIDFGAGLLSKRQAEVIVDRLNEFLRAGRRIHEAG